MRAASPFKSALTRSVVGAQGRSFSFFFHQRGRSVGVLCSCPAPVNNSPIPQPATDGRTPASRATVSNISVHQVPPVLELVAVPALTVENSAPASAAPGSSSSVTVGKVDKLCAPVSRWIVNAMNDNQEVEPAVCETRFEEIRLARRRRRYRTFLLASQ